MAFTRSKLVLIAALFMAGSVQAAEVIDVHRDASCGCCKDWIKYLEANGFEVRDHVEQNMSAVKTELGVAPRLGSCHTGVIDGKFVEGHVPVAQIRELQQRDDLVGVEALRVEDRGRLVAQTPLAVGEGVHREVQEAVELALVPAELADARHGTVRRGRIAGRSADGE